MVAPVIDYSNVINHSVLGGEVSYKGNFTSLTRETAAFDATNATALANGSCLADLGRSGPQHHPGQLPAARHARHLYPRHRRSGLAPLVHRLLGRDLDAVRKPARRRDRRLDLQPARRFELPADRRHPGAAGDADGRPRISLSLHQRSAVGHHDGRADRAGHHPSQRILCRQTAQRRRAELGVRHQQPVQRRQVLRL